MVYESMPVAGLCFAQYLTASCVVQEQLRLVKKELGLEKDDRSALVQKFEPA